MESISQLLAFSKKYLTERIGESTEKILKEFEENKEQVRKEYLGVFHELFLMAAKKQQDEKKGKITYIHIFYLNSALLTGKMELQFSIYDKLSYLDTADCTDVWVPELFTKHFEEDMEWYSKLAYHNIVGFGYKELMEIRQRYYSLYLLLMEQFFLQEAEQITMLESYKQMDKEEKIQILFGGYMDKAIQCWPPIQVKFEEEK